MEAPKRLQAKLNPYKVLNTSKFSNVTIRCYVWDITGIVSMLESGLIFLQVVQFSEEKIICTE